MESIGAKLKKIRLEKGLSLEDVHKKVKIHLNLLKAIEEGSPVDLSPVYLKGFIKIYAKFLGVDFCQEPSAAQTKAAVKEARPVSFIQSASSRMGPLGPWRNTRLYLAVIFAVISLLIIFSLGKLIAFKRSVRAAQKNIKLLQEAPAHPPRRAQSAQPQKTRVSGVIPAAQIITANSSNAVGVRLTINAREDCWIKVKSDGKLLYHGVLKKGRPDSWIAKEKINLSLGNAGVVELNVNGQPVLSLGRKGQVIKDIVITRGGLSVQR